MCEILPVYIAAPSKLYYYTMYYCRVTENIYKLQVCIFASVRVKILNSQMKNLTVYMYIYVHATSVSEYSEDIIHMYMHVHTYVCRFIGTKYSLRNFLSIIEQI